MTRSTQLDQEIDQALQGSRRDSYPNDLVRGDVVVRRDVRGRSKYVVSHTQRSGGFTQVHARKVGDHRGQIVTFDRSQLRTVQMVDDAPASEAAGGGPRILSISKGRSFADRRQFDVEVQYPGEAPMRVSFVGPSRDIVGPVVMILRGRQDVVHDPGRFGAFSQGWIRRFYQGGGGSA